MSVKLTFRKDFDSKGAATPGEATILPFTVDGERVEDVISCLVESSAEHVTIMTLKVHVRETFAENAAVRLKKS